MMLIIFPPYQKKDVIVFLVTVPEKVQESQDRSLEIHVTWHVERNVGNTNFPGKATRNISELLENWKWARAVAVHKQ